jgi:hypothetical protein
MQRCSIREMVAVPVGGRDFQTMADCRQLSKETARGQDVPSTKESQKVMAK